MKKKSSINIGLIIIILAELMLLTGCGKKDNVDIENYKSIYFYTGHLVSNASYEIIDKKVKVVYAGLEFITPTKEYEVELNDEDMEKINNIIKKYKTDIKSWNGFNKNEEVLDGNSFYLTIQDNDSNNLKVSCYGCYPKKGREFEDEITEALESIIGKSRFGELEYDIIIERKRHEEVDSNTISETEYYWYTFINSRKMEKYIISHANSENSDKITVSIQEIDENELQKYIEEYGKESELLNVKDLLTEDIKGEYSVFYYNF